MLHRDLVSCKLNALFAILIATLSTSGITESIVTGSGREVFGVVQTVLFCCQIHADAEIKFQKASVTESSHASLELV